MSTYPFRLRGVRRAPPVSDPEAPSAAGMHRDGGMSSTRQAPAPTQQGNEVSRPCPVAADPNRMPFMYRLYVHGVLPILLRILTRPEIRGREHLPAEGPMLLVANHVDNWDPYVTSMAVRDRMVHHMARADGVESRWLGLYWRHLGTIRADRAGVAEAIRVLRAGGVVGVYPEGCIAPAMVKAGPGAAVLALRAGAPVVPVAITGTERISRNRPWRRPRVVVSFGPPRKLDRKRGIEAASDELMRAIAAMLPPEYRGVYGVGGGIG